MVVQNLRECKSYGINIVYSMYLKNTWNCPRLYNSNLFKKDRTRPQFRLTIITKYNHNSANILFKIKLFHNFFWATNFSLLYLLYIYLYLLYFYIIKYIDKPVLNNLSIWCVAANGIYGSRWCVSCMHAYYPEMIYSMHAWKKRRFINWECK